MTNELVIDVSPSEISIALLEDKQLVELAKEKNNKKFAVGDIYLGKVKKIMPGLNAAFVDVGYEKDAFLHYLDLGPQFRTLNEYVQLSLSTKGKVPPFQNFKTKPDIDKNGKITDVLTTGQMILVQVAKEPISTKGPRISTEISIAGRNLVLMPFADKVSISQKIKSAEERHRLKKLIQSIRPTNYGVIIRTVAEGKRAATLDTELRSLVDKWENVITNLHTFSHKNLVLGELDRTSAILRDILNSSFNNIYVNDEAVHEEIQKYIEEIAPEKLKIVKLYINKIPIFEHFGVDKQVKASFGRTVTFKNGAYLIVEHTEALHVIDVNSGNRSKRTIDQETNALEVNLSAAEEIARQLRLRDMGGIIVVDFIDMHSPENKLMLYERMKIAMEKDRTKHNILQLSKFGLMQITRQRVRPETNIKTLEKCPTCMGSGEISPSVLIIDEIENNLLRIINKFQLGFLQLKVHPFVASYLKKGLISTRIKWSIKYKILLRIKVENSYSFLEYHFFNRIDEEVFD